MASVPTENALSGGISLLREGFSFIPNRRKKYRSDVFQLKLAGFKIICIGGEEAAGIFYDPSKFVRKGAVPIVIQKTLTGEKAIHTTDGAVHQNRKRMFLSLMTDENIGRLADLVEKELKTTSLLWEKKNIVIMFCEAQEILCKAICHWAGVPLKGEDAERRGREFIAMVDAFGAIGPRNWRGMKARRSVEKWIKGVIEDTRANRITVQQGTALDIVASHRQTNGKLFDSRLAAVELINLLRPTVAISYYIAFGGHAFYHFPETRSRFILNEDNYRERFIHELRRYYPFAPFMGARVKESFEWKGCKFPEKSLVLLDMFGTNHDARIWDNPDDFNPDRFIGRKIRPFDFLAQGGGDHQGGHRCPGEWITIEVLKTFFSFLLQKTDFEIPGQDLSYDLSRMPTFPRSGFLIKNVRSKVIV